jgi:molybdopterin converting factor subunit 1
MRIKVRFFASLRERLGRSEEIREVPPGATVAVVWDGLMREHPELAAMERSLAFAVAQEYVDKDRPLQDNDELAVIPPVSGGETIAVEDCGSLDREDRVLFLVLPHSLIVIR